MNQLLAAFILAVAFLTLLLSAASAELPPTGSKRRRHTKEKAVNRKRSQSLKNQYAEV